MTVFGLVKRFSPYLGRVRWRALASAGLTLLSPVFGVALLWLVKSLIDQVFVAGHMQALGPFLAIYIALTGAKLLLSHVGTRLDASITEQITLDLRTDLYRHLISVSPGSLNRFGVGELLSHLSGDTGRTEYLVYSGLVSVVANAVSGLLFFVFLFALSWKLTLCSLAVVPLLAFVTHRFSPKVRRAGRITRRQTTAWMSLAEERLGAVALIHAFDAHAREADKFKARCAVSRRAELRAVALQAKLSSILEAIGLAGGVLVLAVGAAEIHAGHLSVGALMAFIGSVGSLFGPVRSLAKSWSRFHRSAAGAQRVAELLDAPSLVAEHPKARPLPSVRGALEFRDVRFAYARGPEVLKGVSLRIEPGERVALVGASGGGKSTLARLAMRLYDPTAGQVLIDGHDLREVTLESLRRAACVVFQEPYIFRGSIGENIRYGDPDAPEARVEAMARAAHADGFIDALGGRYTASVGPRGAWLSGGQRQRLALARALMRNAPILILDEATASVDSETEELIQDAVERLAGWRTVVTVAHRLSSVQRADRVVVLDQGRIVEVGTPEALLHSASRCRDLFAAQLIKRKAAA